MCVIFYKLFKCGCKEAKSVDPCPMMDKALDLVDIRGVPENDPSIQRLEDQCGEKSAARYEIQREICDLCSASIAAVGMEVWAAAKERRDLDEESKYDMEMGVYEATARAPQKSLADLDYREKDDYFDDGDEDYDNDGTSTASVGTAKALKLQPEQTWMIFLRDNVIDGPSSSSAHAAKATVPQPWEDTMNSLGNKKDAANPADLEVALAAVIAARVSLADFYDDENIYDADGDDDPVGVVDHSVVRSFRLRATSPSDGLECKDGGLGIRLKNKTKH